MPINYHIYTTNLQAGVILVAAICAARSVYECWFGIAAVVGYGLLAQFRGINGLPTRDVSHYKVATSTHGEFWSNNYHSNDNGGARLKTQLNAYDPEDSSTLGYFNNGGNWYHIRSASDNTTMTTMTISTIDLTDNGKKRATCMPVSCAVTKSYKGYDANYVFYADNASDAYYELNSEEAINQFIRETYSNGMAREGLFCLNAKKWQTNYSASYGGAIAIYPAGKNTIYNPTAWAADCNGQSKYWSTVTATCSGCN